VLVDDDLTTGLEVARVTLVDVPHGYQHAPGDMNHEMPGNVLEAGLAVSPDGRRLHTAGPTGGREFVAWIAEPEGYVRSYVVRRLDTATLDIIAEHELADCPRLLLAPSATESR
jgi:hypothetical protein